MKQLILSFSFLFSSILLIAQDPHFSQYNTSRTYTNPAFTGTDSTLVLATGYRMQWPNIDGGYKTFYFSADQYVRFLRGGFGINYINDNEGNGLIVNNRLDVNYAPHYELFKHKLVIQPAISIGLFKKTIDWSKMTFGDQIDPQTGFVYNTNAVQHLYSKSGIDFSAGLLIYSNQFYGGFAAHHLTQPDEGIIGISKLPMRLSMHTGANLSFNTKNLTLSPNILFAKQQDFQIFLPGLSAKYKWGVLGLSYRNQDAFIINAGFQNRFLKIAYSYDYTISKLTNKTTGGSHEIQLAWFLHYQKKVCRIKTIRMI
ncbi:MAG: PorP/SprF family type IX secretion system membrane protein [Bacteroidota bacterium]|nr:PorP/SprF family type IX secretion system membrane protein [Bacteroidota bacterium]